MNIYMGEIGSRVSFFGQSRGLLGCKSTSFVKEGLQKYNFIRNTFSALRAPISTPNTCICGVIWALEVRPSLPKSVLPVCYPSFTHVLVKMSLLAAHLPTHAPTHAPTHLVFLGLGWGNKLVKGHFGGDWFPGQLCGQSRGLQRGKSAVSVRDGLQKIQLHPEPF